MTLHDMAYLMYQNPLEVMADAAVASSDSC